ncbi:MAG: thioredoxin fold domain-containing protein [Nitrospirota bacterium]
MKLHQEMKKVVAERKDIAFYIKLFPLPMHKDAYGKSKAVVCEKSLELLEDAYNKRPMSPAKCGTTAIDENIQLARKLNITGTPALIFPDGVVVPGYIEAGRIKEMVDKK